MFSDVVFCGQEVLREDIAIFVGGRSREMKHTQAVTHIRLCDANDAMNPFDLADRPGRVLRVPSPQV